MEENRNSVLNGTETGSEGDDPIETPTEPGTTEEPMGKPEGTETTGANPDDVTGETVFGEEEKPKSQFKSVEDAEKSWRESQSYASKLQSELETVKRELDEAKKDGGSKPEISKLEAEIKKIKINQTINDAFSSFRETHSDFTGNIQRVAKDIIHTHISAGKPIKLLDAYVQAKAKLGIVDGESDPSVNQKKIQSAVLGGSNSGSLPITHSGKNYDPNSEEAMAAKFDRNYPPAFRNINKK